MSFSQVKYIVDICVKNILDENCGVADAWAMVLSNISRPEDLVDDVIDALESKIRSLVSAFTRVDFNKKGCHLNYLGIFGFHGFVFVVVENFTFIRTEL